MWSYYGSKSKIVKKYPKPIYDTIIEPFAGSARYALEYWEKDVILIDKYPVIIDLWKFLKQASPKDILGLPIPEKGETLKSEKYSYLSVEEKMLMGFAVQSGVSTPRFAVSKVGNFYTWERDRIRMAENLYKIKHWQFILGEYDCLKNIKATYFIDPPYQKMGFCYKYNSAQIDFNKLSNYCKSRNGQVIVCENEGADWLDFKFLTITNGQTRKTKEVMWYSEN